MVLIKVSIVFTNAAIKYRSSKYSFICLLKHYETAAYLFSSKRFKLMLRNTPNQIIPYLAWQHRIDCYKLITLLANFELLEPFRQKKRQYEKEDMVNHTYFLLHIPKPKRFLEFILSKSTVIYQESLSINFGGDVVLIFTTFSRNLQPCHNR